MPAIKKTIKTADELTQIYYEFEHKLMDLKKEKDEAVTRIMKKIDDEKIKRILSKIK